MERNLRFTVATGQNLLIDIHTYSIVSRDYYGTSLTMKHSNEKREKRIRPRGTLATQSLLRQQGKYFYATLPEPVASPQRRRK